MNIFFLIQNHDRNPGSTTTANVCLIGLYNWSLIGLYLVSIWSLGGLYASSDENLKSKHVIGNRVLSVAISIVTLSFPRAPAFLIDWRMRFAQIDKCIKQIILKLISLAVRSFSRCRRETVNQSMIGNCCLRVAITITMLGDCAAMNQWATATEYVKRKLL